MKVMRCEKGHFYDGDKYDDCPYCSELGEVSSSKAKLEPEIMRDPEGIMEDPAFLYCENGHYYDIWKCDRCPICGTAELWKREKQKAEKEKPPMKLMHCENGHTYNQELYDRCPICEKAEREKREKQLRMNIMRCEQGHFYNGAVYDSCPYCCGEALKENGLPDEKQQNGQEENMPDKGGNSGGKEKLIATITYCKRKHYYDGELYDTCPYCGKQEDESSSDGSFEFFGRPDNRGMYHVEFWDVTKSGEVNRVYGYTTVPPEAGGRPALEIKKCGKGHYFDGNREKVCPYCGDAAAETIETI